MNTEVADRTWVIPYEGVDYIVCGVKYVGPVWVREGRMSMVAEDTVGALVYSAAGVQRVAGRRMPVGRGGRSGWSEFDSTGVVGNWVRQDATGAAAPDYDDRLWKYETWPLQMGADGDTTADAWYRAHLAVDTAGVYTLLVGGADRGRAYVDGKPVDTFNIKDGAIPLGLTAGKHVLAVFTAHDGRDKLPAYLGCLKDG